MIRTAAPAPRAVEEIEARLSELRARQTSGRAAAEPRSLNLVTVAGHSIGEGAEAITQQVATDLLAQTFVLYRSEEQSPGSVAAQVTSLTCDAADVPVLVPRVDLWLGPRVLELAKSVLLPLLGSRLRTVVFLASGADRVIAEAVSSLAHEIVVDSAQDLSLALWAATRTDQALLDLTLLRSLRWRELVARSFDPVETRRAVWAIRRVAISQVPSRHGGALEAELLIAWLGSRLGWYVDGRQIRDQSGREIQVDLSSNELATVPRGSLQSLDLQADADSGELSAAICREVSTNRLAWSLRVPGAVERTQRIPAALPVSYHLASRALATQKREPAALGTLRWLGQWRPELCNRSSHSSH